MAEIHPADNSAWVDASRYNDAEAQLQVLLARGNLIICEDSLAGQVQKARLQLQDQMQNVRSDFNNPLSDRIAKLEQERTSLKQSISLLEDRVQILEGALANLMKKFNSGQQSNGPAVVEVIKAVDHNKFDKDPDDDDAVDLFDSESDDDEIAAKVREERLAAYNAKKANKKPLIAKSSIIFDVKPWDDETNMKELEKSVRSIQQDGLLWGASKLVPLAYGIHKLQINCVIEDDKVSVDALQEQIEQNGADFIQSVDIAAFNKI